VFVADVMGHPTRPWRKDGEVGPSLTLKLELGAFQAVTNLVIGHGESTLLTDKRSVALDCSDLSVTPRSYPGRCGGVVAVTVDDHPTDSTRLLTILRTVCRCGKIAEQPG
jgi:hypothetical protein